MRRSFDAGQRRVIVAALASRRGHDPIPCPACGVALHETPIATPAQLPYVRSRVMLVCGACELGAAFDVRSAGRP